MRDKPKPKPKKPCKRCAALLLAKLVELKLDREWSAGPLFEMLKERK